MWLAPVIGVVAVAAQLPAPPGQPPDVDAAVTRRLVDALKDPDFQVRLNLATALAKIGPSTVEPLIEALKDGLPERRSGAAYALALIGPPARAATAGLLKCLDDPDVEVRRQASYALTRMLPAGRPADPRAARTPPPQTARK